MDEPKNPESYEPPAAEEIDTGLNLAETASGGPGISRPPGVEESSSWHEGGGSDEQT